MKKNKIVGQSVRRLDALEKAMGTATFTTDVTLPGMLYAKVLRSPYAHARIVSIDTTEAEKLSGVKAVATHKNTSREMFNTAACMVLTVKELEPVWDQNIFNQELRFMGDEVAAVAAVSEDIAKEALKLIKVEYEELPAVFDAFEAMKPEAPVLHPNCHEGKNIPGESVKIPYGDVEKGFAESDIVIEKTFKVPIQKQVQMETHAAVAQVGVDGKVTVWSTTQTPHPTRMILSKVFGIPGSKIRVLNPPYIGGGFGVRIGCSAKAEPIALALALLARKPVKFVYSRKEDFSASDTRHGGFITVKLGAKKEGTFHALDLRAVLNAGAYCSFSVEAPGVLGAMGLAVYRIPNMYFHGHSVYTNITPAGAMRGYGNPQAMFPIDSVVDMMAAELGMDPMELRLKNIMKAGDPWFLPYPCGSSGLAECIEKGAKSVGWERRGKVNQTGAKKLRGFGMGVGTHVSNAAPFCVDYDNAYIAMQQDGSIFLTSGVPDMGTGTSTSLPQIAAEVLGVKFEEVSISFADTLSSPFEIGSHASRTCYAAGTAVVAAAKDLRKQILEFAADVVLKVSPEKLDIADSVVYVVGEENKSITLKELGYLAHLHLKQFIAVSSIVPPNSPPWEAHFAEVEVDTETGKVTVIKVAAAHDVGTVINPMIVEGQIEGGVLMGIGYATTEEIRFDAKGKQLHNSLHNYMLATAEDAPEIDAILVETKDPNGPLGAKGVGETGLVPTAAAISNAVYDATGIRFFEIPLTEERVYKAIKERG
ncbi:MAG TPA: carbon monoxide dehydrogenase [Pelotomaculum sp.]|nr:carbon monoxide dehydrogenase [Pelotomaculum sp.]